MLMMIALLWPMIESRFFSIDKYVSKLHPYSGMSPEQYDLFKQKLGMFRAQLYKAPKAAKVLLDEALEAAREMALCTRTADSTVQEELDSAIDEIRDDLVKRVKQQ